MEKHREDRGTNIARHATPDVSGSIKIEYWEDKNKQLIKSDLFSTVADRLARQIREEGAANNKNQPTQIRKFYDEALRFQAMLAGTDRNDIEKKFKEQLPFIKMLHAKAAYALGRGLVTPKFKEFIDASVGQIKDIQDFTAFMGLFEAFMGYYKYYVVAERSVGDHRR